MRYSQLRHSFASLPALAIGLALCAAMPAAAQDSLAPGAAEDAQAAGGAQAAGEDAAYTGVASWYGAEFHGRSTSSGEVYDKEAMTAAHRTLPFGTLLLVTSLDTKASVVVRVNDRGPFAKDRVLDLSEAAARILGMIPTGTARVSFRVIGPEEAAAFGSPRPAAAPQQAALASSGTAQAEQPAQASTSALPASPQAQAAEGKLCRIQVASYRDAKNAEATLERLKLSGLPGAFIEDAGSYHRVVFSSLPAAQSEGVAAKLRDLGYVNLLITWY